MSLERGGADTETLRSDVSVVFEALHPDRIANGAAVSQPKSSEEIFDVVMRHYVSVGEPEKFEAFCDSDWFGKFSWESVRAQLVGKYGASAVDYATDPLVFRDVTSAGSKPSSTSDDLPHHYGRPKANPVLGSLVVDYELTLKAFLRKHDPSNEGRVTTLIEAMLRSKSTPTEPNEETLQRGVEKVAEKWGVDKNLIEFKYVTEAEARERSCRDRVREFARMHSTLATLPENDLKAACASGANDFEKVKDALLKRHGDETASDARARNALCELLNRHSRFVRDVESRALTERRNQAVVERLPWVSVRKADAVFRSLKLPSNAATPPAIASADDLYGLDGSVTPPLSRRSGTSPLPQGEPGVGDETLPAVYDNMPHELLYPRVLRFYQKYCPPKANETTIQQALLVFRGKERFMFDSLIEKYGPEPAGPPAAPLTAETKSISLRDEIRKILAPHFEPRASLVDEIANLAVADVHVLPVIRSIAEHEDGLLATLPPDVYHEARLLKAFYVKFNVRKTNNDIFAVITLCAPNTAPTVGANTTSGAFKSLWASLEVKYGIKNARQVAEAALRESSLLGTGVPSGTSSLSSTAIANDSDEIRSQKEFFDQSMRVHTFFQQVGAHKSLGEATALVSAFQGHYDAMWEILRHRYKVTGIAGFAAKNPALDAESDGEKLKQERIEAQDKELSELRAKLETSQKKVAALERENALLKKKVAEQSMRLEVAVGVATTTSKPAPAIVPPPVQSQGAPVARARAMTTASVPPSLPKTQQKAWDFDDL